MGLGRAALGFASSLLFGGCTSEVFVCQDDESCDEGMCEADGYCSFADPQCPSGRRYGKFAPEGTAGQCVEAPGTTSAGMSSSGMASASSTSGGVEASTSTSDASTSGAGTTSPDPLTTGPDATGSTSSGDGGDSTTGRESTSGSDSTTGDPIPTCDLLDDFEDAELDGGWDVSEAAFVDEGGGELRIEIDPPLRYVMVTRDVLVDLRAGAFAAELSQPPPIVSVAQAIELLSPVADESLSYLVVGSTLSARHYVGGSFDAVASMPFDPQMHRHIRIRGDADAVVFETSDDGLEFDVHTTFDAPFDLGSVQPRLRAGNWESMDAAQLVSYDDVRLCEDAF